jgi:hypothetical protein
MIENYGFPQSVYDEAEQNRHAQIREYYSHDGWRDNNYYDPAGGQHLTYNALQAPLIDPIDIAAGGIFGIFKASGEAYISRVIAEDILITSEKGAYEGTGQYCVYQLIDPETGTVKYVGITKQDLIKRYMQHIYKYPERALLQPRMIKSFGNTLTSQQARAIEQVLIDMYGLEKNGGQLINKINSIAK